MELILAAALFFAAVVLGVPAMWFAGAALIGFWLGRWLWR